MHYMLIGVRLNFADVRFHFFAAGNEDKDKTAPIVPAAKLKLKDLKVATNDFSRENLLGEGSFGKVYQGTIMDPRAENAGRTVDVAVKKLNPESFQGYQEWLVKPLI